MADYYSNGERKKETSDFQRKMYYLIDTENPGSAVAAELLREEMECREMYFFYTSNSMKQDFETIEWMIQYPEKLHFEKCAHGTKNSLDFQLVTFLGALIREKGVQNRYIILSNDNGFDAVVEFWKQKGIEVSRFGQVQLQTPVNQIADPIHEETEKQKTVEKSVQPEVVNQKINTERVLQVSSAMLGDVLKKRGVKVKKVSKISLYLYKNRNYTQKDLEKITNAEAAAEIMNKVSREEINQVFQNAAKKG